MSNETIATVTTAANTKVVYSLISGSLGTFFAYLNLNPELVSIFFLLMCCDTVVGMIRSAGSNQFSFNKLIAGIFRKVSLMIMVLSLSLLIKMNSVAGLTELSLQWTSSTLLVVLGLGEVISIYNNMRIARGEAPLPEFDAFGVFGSWLKEVSTKLLLAGTSSKNDKPK